MSKCDSCKLDKTCQITAHPELCTGFQYQPTNGDGIRAMTDEQIAPTRILQDYFGRWYAVDVPDICFEKPEDAIQMEFGWLKRTKAVSDL